MIKKTDWFDFVNYAILTLLALITLYPFIYVIAGSFNKGIDYMRGGVWLFPREFTWDNYQVIIHDKRMVIGFRNTILRTVLGTVTGLLFTTMVSYGMSRKDLPGSRIIYWLNIFTMFFAGGMIPFYLVLKSYKLINSFWVYILPNLYSVFNMIIVANYLRDIPEEIHESAVMDGAGEFRILWKIYFPLAKPVLATIALWIAVFHWNSFFDSMIYTTKPELQTLQLVLVKLIKEASMAQGEAATKVPAQVLQNTSVVTIRYAAIVLSSLPIFAFYPFVQKYLLKGVMLGSVKG